MSDDWMPDDPFADPDDPAAREREQRRLEREEKRRKREEKPARSGRQRRRSRGPGAERRLAGAAARLRRAGESSWARPPSDAGVPAEPPSPSESPAAEPCRCRPAAPEAGVLGRGRRAGARSRLRARSAELRQAPRRLGLRGRRRRVRRRASGGGGGRRQAGILGASRRHPFRLVGAIVAVLVALVPLRRSSSPSTATARGKVAVTIPKGASVSEVGDLLGEKGVIDSSTLFQVRVTLDGKRSDLYAGHFTLADGMSYGAAIDALSQAAGRSGCTTVTIPEGYSRPQAAQLVEEDGARGQLHEGDGAAPSTSNPAEYGGKGAKNLEGFLFPDTFELKPEAPVADLVQLQLRTSSGGSRAST